MTNLARDGVPDDAVPGATTTTDAGSQIISDPPLIGLVDSASLHD
jgi:hypothetical protein